MPEDRQVAIVFADVVGSTRLYEHLGDDKARETVQRCLAVMKDATEDFQGTVIKTMGDEVMSTFPEADDAISAAAQMQQRITDNPSFHEEGVHVAIRVGCHFGTVTVDDRDIFGAAVHTANRMTSQAKAGQIMLTGSTVEHLGHQWQALARQIDVTMVKGQADQVELYEVLWQPEEATSMLPALDMGGSAEVTPGVLRLKFGGREYLLGENGASTVTLGRAEDNDLVVKGNLISRIHARIESGRKNFVLVDESTNGTFVQQDDGQEIYVRRDSLELTGSGVIGMGRVTSRGMPLAVEYACEE